MKIKINMRIHWLQLKGPEKEDLPEVRELLKRIEKLLRISDSKNSKNLISLEIKSETDKAILEQLWKTEKVLKVRSPKGVSIGLVKIEVNKKKFNTFCKNIQKKKPATSISFDKKLCIFKYRSEQYKPQRKGGRCQILRKLWEGRKIIDADENEKKVGQSFGLEELAVEAKFINTTLQFNTTAERSVRDAIQDIRDQLRKMKVPVEIVAQNGFILILRE